AYNTDASQHPNATRGKHAHLAQVPMSHSQLVPMAVPAARTIDAVLACSQCKRTATCMPTNRHRPRSTGTQIQTSVRLPMNLPRKYCLTHRRSLPLRSGKCQAGSLLSCKLDWLRQSSQNGG